jgi:predicted neuraminidase
MLTKAAILHIGLTLAALVAIGTAAGKLVSQTVDASPFIPMPQREPTGTERLEYSLRGPITGIAHSASAIELPDGRILAFWFEGSREGASDVSLKTSEFVDGTGWGPPREVTDGRRTGKDQGRYIDTVGNPVVFRHPDGEYWLIYVTVSYGGWALSSINLIRSPDGIHWGRSERLVTSPAMNLSTLVRTPPLMREDGLIVLPVYHELLTTFPELILIDREGRVVGKTRLSGPCRIQPWIVALDANHAVALMRDHSCTEHRLWRSVTSDAGVNWENPHPLDIHNPDAPAAALALPGGKIIAAFNAESRERLEIGLSDDEGRSWTLGQPIFDRRSDRCWLRYPWLMQDQRGRIHVLVTEICPGRGYALRHVILDRASVQQLMESG